MQRKVSDLRLCVREHKTLNDQSMFIGFQTYADCEIIPILKRFRLVQLERMRVRCFMPLKLLMQN